MSTPKKRQIGTMDSYENSSTIKKGNNRESVIKDKRKYMREKSRV